MKSQRITKRFIDGIEPGAKDQFFWDSSLRGFGVKVTPKGAVIFMLQRRVHGKPQRLTIGRHDAGTTVEQARTKAEELSGQIAAGKDPKAPDRSLVTVADLGRRYLDEYAKVHKKPSSYAQDRSHVENHVIPLVGTTLVSQLTREDVSRVLRLVKQGETAKSEKTEKGTRRVKGGQTVANRVHAVLSKMMRLAEDWRIRDENTNPCRGVKKFAEKKMSRFLSDDEFKRLGTALDRAETAAREQQAKGPPGGDKASPEARQRHHQHVVARLSGVRAVRLLALTGCRVGEILALKWSDIDRNRQVLLIADSKTGAKEVRATPEIEALLRGVVRTPGNPYVLPGRKKGEHLTSLRKLWMDVCKGAGLKEVRLHDLRHSYASVGLTVGQSLSIVGKLMGHTQPATTNRYAHLAAVPAHRAATEISGRISAAMSGKGGGGKRRDRRFRAARHLGLQRSAGE